MIVLVGNVGEGVRISSAAFGLENDFVASAVDSSLMFSWVLPVFALSVEDRVRWGTMKNKGSLDTDVSRAISRKMESGQGYRMNSIAAHTIHEESLVSRLLSGVVAPPPCRLLGS